MNIFDWITNQDEESVVYGNKEISHYIKCLLKSYKVMTGKNSKTKIGTYSVQALRTMNYVLVRYRYTLNRKEKLLSLDITEELANISCISNRKICKDRTSLSQEIILKIEQLKELLEV